MDPVRIIESGGASTPTFAVRSPGSIASGDATATERVVTAITSDTSTPTTATSQPTVAVSISMATPNNSGSSTQPFCSANTIESRPLPGNPIVFAGLLPGQTGPTTLFAIQPDGTGLKQITGPNSNVPETSGANEVDRDPVWSPDGTRIAFSRSDGGGKDIWLINADGRGLCQLTTEGGDEYNPSWSPDGAKIAYTQKQAGVCDIDVINADGTGWRPDQRRWLKSTTEMVAIRTANRVCESRPHQW